MPELVVERATEQWHVLIQSRHANEDQPAIGKRMLISREHLGDKFPWITDFEMEILFIS
ncbi:hypothetical protein X765_13620 [Mesorhizobium sp. LSHC440B00]|nr:hypothetical protein X765_13620 [Mesorhizobium sp. LSHC440B00]ESX37782.1 hypothetical protein X763_13315 [Mesorhizobium sp. LSHC432A00]ESX43255.1 hypothetical protein X764_07400 [Mesorhizobium sp. LSHC440A00]